jgi:hypothetical protein
MFSPNKQTMNDPSDYNNHEILAINSVNSILNTSHPLKLCDYLKIDDKKVEDKKSLLFIGNHLVPEDPHKYGANISFESLSAVAKIFSNNYKSDQDSELDFDDDRINRTNIEEITEEGLMGILEKRNSHPDPSKTQKENMQSNLLLINAIQNAAKKKAFKHNNEAISNSVIIEGDRIKYKKAKRHSKYPRMNVSNRKFNAKSKKTNDSQILYSEDYKDYMPKKRQILAGNKATSGSRRSK